MLSIIQRILLYCAVLPVSMYAMDTGNTAQYSKIRWMIDNMPPGGLGYRDTRIQNSLSSQGSLSPPIFYFLASDPNAPPAADPRPAMTTDFLAPGTGVLLSRTDWTSAASW